MNRFVWDDSGEIHSLRAVGHQIMVRRCLRRSEEYLVGDVPEKPAEKIVFPDYFVSGEHMLLGLQESMGQSWVEVLAIGDRCGTRRSNPEMKRFLLPKGEQSNGRKYGIPRHLINPVHVGDFVVIPGTSRYSTMYNRITGMEYDGVVDESELMLLHQEVKGVKGENKIMTKPLGMTVLIKLEDSIKEKGGIIYADIAQNRPTIGKVVELGTGIIDESNKPVPFDVIVGDRVLVPMFGGTDVTLNHEKYRIVAHDSILGVVEK